MSICALSCQIRAKCAIGGIPMVRCMSTLISREEVVRFVSDCMEKVGASKSDAHIVGHHLMTADYRGHFSHGMNRVPMYVKDIESKLTDPHAKPMIVKDFQATALVDGNNALGQVTGNYSMELTIQKAKSFGIGIVSARGSNHYGICGYYSLMAAEEGLIGFSCTNSSPLMVPTRGKASALGTNPLSLAMKSRDDEFVLDMATTAIALGKVEVALNKGVPILEGCAFGADGKETTDPKDANEARKLMPLGGKEITSGFKGYGLGTMVEILCGVLSGSHFGPNIRSWTSGDRPADLGHCFMAINPEVFAPGAGDRLSQLLKQLREIPTAHDAPGSVLVAGDPERISMHKVDEQGGIEYHPNQIKVAKQLADKCGVTPMKPVPK